MRQNSFLSLKFSTENMAPKLMLSAGLEPVLSHTEKLCIASNYGQFSTNIKIKILKLIPVLLVRTFQCIAIRDPKG